MLGKTAVRLALPLTAKAVFWGTVVYVGPIVAVTTLGATGFLAAVATVHIAIPTVAAFI